MSFVMKMFISFMLILFWIFTSILVKKIPDKVFYKERVAYKVKKELYIKNVRRTIDLLIFWNIILSAFMWVGSEITITLLSFQSFSFICMSLKQKRYIMKI
ncbi:MAG: hypothetical protein E6248_11660 [Clostridium sp.]|uniref:hypothetical protein n=1 Tax=Clostridium sp. TaxID=1506 RepID=UPI00290E05EC|nr:hypothetical protein [Clostridium sp.]MDU5111098.1 hypothetical protein [Clostridium sp.]